MRIRLVVAFAYMFLTFGSQAWGHRLDEYLQNTLVSLEKNRLDVYITLTPGVAVFPLLRSAFDSDADGSISENEKLAYAETVLRDLSFSLDGKHITPRLAAIEFPTLKELSDGNGTIDLHLTAELPAAPRQRTLLFENRHHREIAAYLVNCLVPNDRLIRMKSQQRNYTQERYELQYELIDLQDEAANLRSWSGRIAWIGIFALVLVMPFAFRRSFTRVSS